MKDEKKDEKKEDKKKDEEEPFTVTWEHEDGSKDTTEAVKLVDKAEGGKAKEGEEKPRLNTFQRIKNRFFVLVVREQEATVSNRSTGGRKRTNRQGEADGAGRECVRLRAHAAEVVGWWAQAVVLRLRQQHLLCTSQCSPSLRTAFPRSHSLCYTANFVLLPGMSAVALYFLARSLPPSPPLSPQTTCLIAAWVIHARRTGFTPLDPGQVSRALAYPAKPSEIPDPTQQGPNPYLAWSQPRPSEIGDLIQRDLRPYSGTCELVHACLSSSCQLNPPLPPLP
eukprot:1934655-Rhodomonas_salina.1